MSSPAENKYPWYEVIEGAAILQGDLFVRCPVLVPTVEAVQQAELNNNSLDLEILEYDVVVMSQSCDLEQGKLDLVLVCPVWDYSEFSANDGYMKSREGKRNLQQGTLPGYHLLKECDMDGWQSAIKVVDFRNVYGVPYPFLMRFAEQHGPRLRLLPPYREHLAQAFARYFMRVGLPVNITL